MEINLLPYQIRVIKSQAKYIGLIAGTGTGKTYLLPRYLYARMSQFPGFEWIVSSPTIPMLKRNPQKYLEKFFAEQKIQYRFNKTDLTFELKGKGVIYLISAENPDRMQGVHAKGIIGDEAGIYSRLWWDTAVQRVAFNKGQILLLTTPYALNWLKTDFYDEFLKKNPDFHVENPTSIDNPFYPKDEFERARARLPDWKFKMLFLGLFTKPAGLIYPEYEIVDDFQIPADWIRFRGLDFGFNHPVAIPWIAKDPKTGIYYLYKEFKVSGLDLDQIDNVLKDDSGMVTYGDNAQRTDLQTLINRGRNIRLSNKSVLSGVLFVSSLFREKRLKIFRSCKQAIDELNIYQWQIDKAENIKDEPKKINDDLMDAMRYALYTYGDSQIDFSPIQTDWI